MRSHGERKQKNPAVFGYDFIIAFEKIFQTGKQTKVCHFFKKHATDIVYLSFIIAVGGFFYSMYFDRGEVFRTVSVGALIVYTVFTLLGFQLDFDFKGVVFSQKTLLKIGVLTLSVFLICMNGFISFYDIEHHKTLILLVGTLAYIIGFVFVFSDIFEKIHTYFHSRRFRTFAVRNTYNFLSLFFILIAVFLLMIKFGFFHNLRDIFIPKTQAPVVQEETPEIISEEEPVKIEPVYETRTLGDLYVLNEFMSLGSQGSQVSELQDALTLIGIYTGGISGEYDEPTREALTTALQDFCDWPESTQGIFGPLAQECINSIEIQIPVEPVQEEIISDEGL